MNKDQLQAELHAVALISREDNEQTPWSIAQKVHKLAVIGRSLHKRYEASCSFEWANTKTYERQTEALERQAAKLAVELGVELELQTDPRGWPLILSVGDCKGGKAWEVRLG